jgi:hypothetical protein
MGGRPLILLDASLPIDDRISVLAGALATCDVTSIHMPPAVRARIDVSAPSEPRQAQRNPPHAYLTDIILHGPQADPRDDSSARRGGAASRAGMAVGTGMNPNGYPPSVDASIGARAHCHRGRLRGRVRSDPRRRCPMDGESPIPCRQANGHAGRGCADADRVRGGQRARGALWEDPRASLSGARARRTSRTWRPSRGVRGGPFGTGGSDERGERAIAATGQPVLLKPFTAPELRAFIEKFLG